MKCDTCREQIPEERLDILPDTTTCVKCSREPARQWAPDGTCQEELTKTAMIPNGEH